MFQGRFNLLDLYFKHISSALRNYAVRFFSFAFVYKEGLSKLPPFNSGHLQK